MFDKIWYTDWHTDRVRADLSDRIFFSARERGQSRWHKLVNNIMNVFQFSPTEPGDYRVEVRWAGRHVPGSPFPVMIFDTQEELRRYMQASAA